MAYLYIDFNNSEKISEEEPVLTTVNRHLKWYAPHSVTLPKGTIKKLIGAKLNKEDKPYYYNENTY